MYRETIEIHCLLLFIIVSQAPEKQTVFEPVPCVPKKKHRRVK